MFVKYDFIPENHKSVLSQLIRQKDYITEKLMASLYQACLSKLADEASDTPGFNASVIRSPDCAVATATDERSGVYLQLAATAARGKLITVGQRWAMEGVDPSTSTTAVRIWA